RCALRIWMRACLPRPGTRTGAPRRPAGDPAEAFLPRDVEQAARARSSPTGRRTTRFVGSSTQNRRPGPHELRRHAVASRPTVKAPRAQPRSEEHTSELQSRFDLVCRLLLEKKNRNNNVEKIV